MGIGQKLRSVFQKIKFRRHCSSVIQFFFYNLFIFPDRVLSALPEADKRILLRIVGKIFHAKFRKINLIRDFPALSVNQKNL